MGAWPATVLLAALSATEPTALGALIDEYRESQNVPGISAVVVSADTVVFAGASGVADLETQRALTADDVFYIGSLSKVLTAVLALHLVEDNRLTLDTVVPGIGAESAPRRPPVRVAHLLTHSAGLEREGDFDYWFTADFPGDVALAAYLANAQLRDSPGVTLHYSNVGYAALGPVIERASGQSFAAALQSRVLDPLGMRHAGATGPAPNAVSGYTPPGRVIPSAERPFAGIGRKIGNRRERMYHDAQAMSPAFGAFASANDLGNFARFLLQQEGDGVLSPPMRALMREPQLSGWGLGLRIEKYRGRTVARHGGWFAAHRTHLLLDSANGIGVVVMSNSDNANPPRIADALLEATLGSIQRTNASLLPDARSTGQTRIPVLPVRDTRHSEENGGNCECKKIDFVPAVGKIQTDGEQDQSKKTVH